jgi:hypothetical protein
MHKKIGIRPTVPKSYGQKNDGSLSILSESGGKLEPLTRPGKDDNKQGCVQANATAAANRSLSAK